MYKKVNFLITRKKKAQFQTYPLHKDLAVHVANVVGCRTNVLPVQDLELGQEEHHFVLIADLQQQEVILN